MAYKLQLKRGLLSALPIGISGEPLFTTDTNDLYISNGTTNQKFQKFIASGTSSQFLKGDGSLDSTTYQPLLTNPVTGTGTTNYLTKWTSGSAIGNSIITDSGSIVTVGGGLTSETITLQPQALNTSTYKITQQMASNDYWSIYGFATVADEGDLFFELQDNASFANGQRFRFYYGNASSGIPKDILLMNYNGATFDGTLKVTDLAGIGTRMVVSDVNGVLSTQAIATNLITGTGTTNYLPKFTGTSSVGNSLVYDSGTAIGIGTTSPSALLHLYQNIAGVQNKLILENVNTTAGADGSSIYFKGFHGSLAKISGFGFPQDAFGGTLQLQSYSDNTTANVGIIITRIGNTLVNSLIDNGSRFQVDGTATFSSSVTATSFIKTGGTSSQYLMADGSVTTGGGGGSVDELQVALICQVFG